MTAIEAVQIRSIRLQWQPCAKELSDARLI